LIEHSTPRQSVDRAADAPLQRVDRARARSRRDGTTGAAIKGCHGNFARTSITRGHGIHARAAIMPL